MRIHAVCVHGASALFYAASASGTNDPAPLRERNRKRERKEGREERKKEKKGERGKERGGKKGRKTGGRGERDEGERERRRKKERRKKKSEREKQTEKQKHLGAFPGLLVPRRTILSVLKYTQTLTFLTMKILQFFFF